MAKIEDPGRVEAICISEKKGEKKKAVDAAVLIENFGIEGDAHAGSKRQVSLLSIESIQKMKDKGLKVGYGDFAENIATSGIDLVSLKIGAQIQISDAVLEITEIGKVCKTPCSIYYQVGDCVMPKEGVFANVIKGGKIKNGDAIRII